MFAVLIISFHTHLGTFQYCYDNSFKLSSLQFNFAKPIPSDTKTSDDSSSNLRINDSLYTIKTKYLTSVPENQSKGFNLIFQNVEVSSTFRIQPQSGIKIVNNTVLSMIMSHSTKIVCSILQRILNTRFHILRKHHSR